MACSNTNLLTLVCLREAACEIVCFCSGVTRMFRFTSRFFRSGVPVMSQISRCDLRVSRCAYVVLTKLQTALAHGFRFGEFVDEVFGVDGDFHGEEVGAFAVVDGAGWDF